MRFKIFHYFLCLICFNNIELIHGKRDFKVILKKCETNTKPARSTKYVNCSITQDAHNPERTFLNGGFELKENVTNFDLRITFDMLRKDNTKINLINQAIDGCKFLEAIYGHSILRNVLREIRRSSNLPKKCPVGKDIYYEVKSFAINEDDYPAFLPSLSFVLVCKFYVNQYYEGDFTVTGRVKKL